MRCMRTCTSADKMSAILPRCKINAVNGPTVVCISYPANRSTPYRYKSSWSLALSIHVPSAGILEKPMKARNEVGIGLSYRPARLQYIGLAESIPWNQFLGLQSLKIPALNSPCLVKYSLRIFYLYPTIKFFKKICSKKLKVVFYFSRHYFRKWCAIYDRVPDALLLLLVGIIAEVSTDIHTLLSMS